MPRTVSDAILADKMYEFLFNANVSPEQLAKFKKKFSDVNQKKLWSSVIHAVNSHDNKIKSGIVGRLFNKLIDDYIDEHEFATLVHAVNSMNVALLGELKGVYMLIPEVVLPTNIYNNFSFIGLINADNSNVGSMNGGGPKYPPNNLGWKFVSIVFNLPESGVPGVNIGEGKLYREVDEHGMVTGRSLPLGYMISEGLIYQEINGYIIDNDCNILVHEDNLKLYVHDPHQVPPELQPNELAIFTYRNFTKGPVAISSAHYDNKQVTAYLLESPKPIKGTKFVPVVDIIGSLQEAKMTDIVRSSIEVMRQVDRFQNVNGGELHAQWISAYDNLED